MHSSSQSWRLTSWLWVDRALCIHSPSIAIDRCALSDDDLIVTVTLPLVHAEPDDAADEEQG